MHPHWRKRTQRQKWPNPWTGQGLWRAEKQWEEILAASDGSRLDSEKGYITRLLFSKRELLYFYDYFSKQVRWNQIWKTRFRPNTGPNQSNHKNYIPGLPPLPWSLAILEKNVYPQGPRRQELALQPDFAPWEEGSGLPQKNTVCQLCLYPPTSFPHWAQWARKKLYDQVGPKLASVLVWERYLLLTGFGLYMLILTLMRNGDFFPEHYEFL